MDYKTAHLVFKHGQKRLQLFNDIFLEKSVSLKAREISVNHAGMFILLYNYKLSTDESKYR